MEKWCHPGDISSRGLPADFQPTGFAKGKKPQGFLTASLVFDIIHISIPESPLAYRFSNL
jgi:hypothetical protein